MARIIEVTDLILRDAQQSLLETSMASRTSSRSANTWTTPATGLWSAGAALPSIRAYAS